MKSDIEIAQSVMPLPVVKIAQKLNVSDDDLQQYGKFKAKLPLSLIDEDKVKRCKLILVSAISPTPAGEGKTTTSIGLAEGMNRIGRKTTVVLREPSLGPVFGMKGGATGGGWSQVIPMEEIQSWH
jgi:formate--tetrahydrofolate ligase